MPGPTDSWITLAGIARETTTIRLGTLVTSATFRHPGPLAISVAEVDAMSGGRVEFGIGAGWFEAEHRAYAIPFPGLGERFDRLEEQLDIITGLWDTPPASGFELHRHALHRRRLPRAAQTGAAPVPADHHRRRRRQAHPRTGGPLRRPSSTSPSPPWTSPNCSSAGCARRCDGRRARPRRPGLLRGVRGVRRAPTTRRSPGARRRSAGTSTNCGPTPRWSGTPGEIVDRLGAVRRRRRAAGLSATARSVRPRPP